MTSEAPRIIIGKVVLLILFVIVGAGMAYLAQNNLMLVTLNLGPYVLSSIPLFYVIVGSLLTGLASAYLIYVVNSLFIAISMRKKDSKIKKSSSEIADLTKQIHQLEIENERLKKNSDEPPDKNAL